MLFQGEQNMREMLGEGSFNKEWEYINITGNFKGNFANHMHIGTHICNREIICKDYCIWEKHA